MTNTEADSRARWQSAPSDDLVWTAWNDEFIAYHRPSGKTHFLNASTHRLITEMLRTPADADSISQQFDVGESDPRRDELAGLLEHLEELGLINRV